MSEAAARGAGLRVLHVDTERTWRGGQAQVAILMDALARRGHRSILAAPDGPLASRAVAAGHDYIPFSPRNDVDVPAAIGLVFAARREKPDVVHLHSGRAHAAGWPAARAAGAAAVLTRRVLFEVANAPRRSLKWKLPLERVIAISHAIQDALVRTGVPAERVAVVADALDVAAFEQQLETARAAGARPTLRRAWGVPEDARLCGMLAAFTSEKDYATFVAAAERVAAARTEVCFVGLGDGPDLPSVRVEVERRGLASRVRLVGRVDDPAAAMAALDAFALISRAEGLGSSILLAQAARLPVVATRVGGIPDLVEDRTSGWLAPPGDADAVARAMSEALAGGPEVERRVAEARRRLDAFDAAASAEAHERIYVDALAARGKPWQRPR